MRVCWRRLKQTGKKGRLTKEHFIFCEVLCKKWGYEWIESPVFGQSVGLKYDTIFPIGERRISLRGWQNAFALCLCSRHLFWIPSSQGASYIHNFPSVLPKISPFTNDYFLFSKPPFYSDPHRIYEGRRNCTCKCPLFIIHLCLLKISLMKTLVGSQSN